MKRHLLSLGSLALVALLGLALVACGGGDDKDGGKKKGKKSSGSNKKSSKTEKKSAAKLDLTKVGSVKGKIVYKGAKPEARKLDVSKDKWCKDNATVFDETKVVGDDGGLRDVVVYIEGLDDVAGEFPAPEKPARVVQKGCRYIPHVLTVRVEQDIEVENADETSHNYHFIGKVNDEINKTQPRPMTDTILFENAEVNADLQCDIHPWMNCKVHIFDHPCFARTSEDGTFEITGIPAGNFKVRFMHETAKGTESMDVTITAGGTKDLGTIEFK